MDEQNQQQPMSVEPTTRSLQFKTFLVGLGATELVDLLAHGGWPGAAFAAGLSLILAAKSPEIVAPFRELLPPVPAWGGRTIIDRMLDRYPEEPAEEPEPVLEVPQPPAHQQEEPVSSVGTLPRRSPTFAQMKHLIPAGLDVLGFDGQRFITADPFSQSVNMAIIGLPRSGKTVCLTFHVAQAVMRGAEIRGWDIHGDVAKSLGNLFHIFDDVEEILNDCECLLQEIDRRSALRKAANKGNQSAVREWEQTPELFLIVDELVALMTRLKPRKQDRQMIASTILLLIAEGAKFKMRCMLAGQTMPASLFGDDGSSARDIIGTKYAFQSRDEQARMFGIDPKAREKLLPLLCGEDYKGYAVLSGGALLQTILVSIPYTTVEDIRYLLDERDGWKRGNGEMPGNEGVNGGKRLPEPAEMKRGNVSAFPGNAFSQEKKPVFDEKMDVEIDEEDLPEGVTLSDLEQIQGAYEAGWALGEIARLVKMDGRKYHRFKAACAYLGIETKAAN